MLSYIPNTETAVIERFNVPKLLGYGDYSDFSIFTPERTGSQISSKLNFSWTLFFMELQNLNFIFEIKTLEKFFDLTLNLKLEFS